MKVKEKKMTKVSHRSVNTTTNNRLKNYDNKCMGNLKSYLKEIPYLKKIKNITVQFSNFLSDIYLDISFSLRRRKGFSSVQCLFPFARLGFSITGSALCCCYAFTKVKSVGNINNETIEQIWNGKKIRRFRKRLLLGQTKKTCESNCPHLFSPPISIKDINTDIEEGSLLYEDIRTGRVKLRVHPLWFSLANYTVCNLNCVMCPSRNSGHRNDAIPDHVKKTHENLRKYFDKRITIFLTGDGDVLARRDTRELLQNFDSKKYSKVTFEILTNGLLFQPHMWETIKHNNYYWAAISIDAATKKTYERIRRGANWEQLMRALEVFKKAKEEGKFSNVIVNMTVMRSNFREIPQFIEMARSMGFKSLFTKIRDRWGDENFFESNDKAAIQELKNVLSDQNIYGDDVHMIELVKYIPGEFRSRLQDFSLTIMQTPYFLLKSSKNVCS